MSDTSAMGAPEMKVASRTMSSNVCSGAVSSTPSACSFARRSTSSAGIGGFIAHDLGATFPSYHRPPHCRSRSVLLRQHLDGGVVPQISIEEAVRRLVTHEEVLVFREPVPLV